MDLTMQDVKIGQTIRKLPGGRIEIVDDVAAPNPKFPARVDDTARRDTVMALLEWCPKGTRIYAVERFRNPKGCDMDFYATVDGEIVYLSFYMHCLGFGGKARANGLRFGLTEMGAMPSAWSVTQDLGELLYGDRYAFTSRVL